MERKQFLVDCGYFAAIIALVYFGINYLLPIIMPFVLGFLIAYIVRNILKKVTKTQNHIKDGLGLVLFYLLTITILFIIISRLSVETGKMVSGIPDFYKNHVLPVFEAVRSDVETYSKNLSPEMENTLDVLYENTVKGLGDAVSSVSKLLLNETKDVVTKIPNFLVSFILMIISSFYFLFDYEKILNGMISLLSPKLQKQLNNIIFFVKNNVFKILRSYVLIMFFTACELFLGFTIFGFSSSLSLALLISALDILPVLGVGTVLLPWGFGQIVLGNVGSGIKLLVLYAIITIVRQIIEPKIVGENLGLHPLLTLFCMIIGLKFFGAVGMFGLPLTASYLLSRKDIEKLNAG